MHHDEIISVGKHIIFACFMQLNQSNWLNLELIEVPSSSLHCFIYSVQSCPVLNSGFQIIIILEGRVENGREGGMARDGEE